MTAIAEFVSPLPAADPSKMLLGQKSAINQVLAARNHLAELVVYAHQHPTEPDVLKLAELPLSVSDAIVLAAAIEFFGVKGGLKVFIEEFPSFSVTPL
jgi:hypothetical protein